MSFGAPAASTGAPNERHCASSGCHSDFPINSGRAELSISIENGITQYEPNKTYAITVSVADPNVVRFGFQVVALKNSDHSNTGNISLSEPARTQIVSGFGNTMDRKYLTYTFDGTNAVSSGLGKWTFNWTAPAAGDGDVTLYAAGISANNDGTDSGDHSYTQKIILGETTSYWKIFPAISSGIFVFQSAGSAVQRFAVYNLSGEKVYEQQNPGQGILTIDLPLGNGMYLVSAIQENKIGFQKIIILR